MALVLHLHPLSSFCIKVLIALYEAGTEFESVTVNLGDSAARAQFRTISPMGKIPALRDETRDRTVNESSIIIEYLDRQYPGPAPLLPADPVAQLEARHWDRFYDQYVHLPAQKIIGDRLRPEDKRDPFGVAEAKTTMLTAYDRLDQVMSTRPWAAGEAFSIADCAALPPLFYGSVVVPIPADRPHLAAYFERLLERPSVQRALAEARPFFQYFPYQDQMPARFR